MPGPSVQIVVWGDCVCPFCYLEMPELEQVTERSAGRSMRDATLLQSSPTRRSRKSWASGASRPW
jgi:predicted DsbA family dithiol-disulfide isomerase